jgi:hypothetical protein
MKITAETITDEQILALFNADEIAAIDLAVATRPGWSAKDRLKARALCAAAFNTSAQERVTRRGRAQRDHTTVTYNGECCTTCGGPIDGEGQCRC